jgi:DNA (cytosine-5)-methyltransferase 1
VPIIDLFAGPGGLGEGFAGLRHGGRRAFRIALSIEKEPWAHATLTLRCFFRQFERRAPEAYYRFLQGATSLEALYTRFPEEARAARSESWLAELGHTDQHEVNGRISEAVGGVKTWVLIGGPPCQAYSLVGRARRRNDHSFAADEKHTLYRQYLQILAKHEPPVFVMENVKGLLSSKHDGESIMHRILADLRRPKEGLRYRLLSFTTEAPLSGGDQTPEPRDFILECERFGAPQRRHRVIILGVRDDLSIAAFRPLRPRPGAVTLRRALQGLPRIRSRISDGPDSTQAWRAALRRLGSNGGVGDDVDPGVARSIRRTLAALDRTPAGTGSEFIRRRANQLLPCGITDVRLGAVCNHSSRSHISQDLHRYMFAACFAQSKGRSPTLSEFPIDLLPRHRNVRRKAEGEPIFADRFRVQLADQPATTVAAHIAKDGHYYIHPDPLQCRSLTVREAARLQTFPDNYFFCGPRTSQYEQVGNAVPPFIARQLATVVDLLLRGQRRS